MAAFFFNGCVMKGQPGLIGEWHQGEPLLPFLGRVLTIQADGDELEIIMDALMKRSQFPENRSLANP